MLNITIVYNIVYILIHIMYILLIEVFFINYYHSVGAVMMLISVELLFD